MADSLGGAVYSISTDNNGLEKGLQSAHQTAKEKTSLIGGLFDGLGKVGLAGMGIKAIGESFAGLASGMVAGNAEFERYETQFGVLLKSTDAATQRLDELAKFGASTPFELPELVNADKVLTAFGLHSADTAKKFGVGGEQILTTIGDVAAGTGVGFEELSLTFGKFASGATGEAISRFQELGIATREEMAGWGLEFSKTGQLLTPADEAFGVLESNVRAKFGGMMDAQSNTFEGMVSNLQDWIGSTKRQLAAPIFEVLKSKLGDVLGFLNSPAAQGALTAFAGTLATGVGKAVDAVKWLSDRVGELVGYLSAGNQVDVMRQWFGDAGPVIDGVVRGVQSVAEQVGWLFDAISEAGFGSSEMFEVLENIIGSDLTTSLKTVGDLVGSIVASFGDVGKAWEELFKTGDVGAFLEDLLGADAKIATALVGIGETLASAIGAELRKVDWGAVWATVGSIAGSIAEWLGSQWQKIDWGAVWASIDDFAGSMGDWLETVDWVKVGGDVARGLGSAFNAAMTAVGNMFSGQGGGIQAGGMERLATSLRAALQAMSIGLGQAIIDGMVGGVSSLGASLMAALSAAIASIKVDVGPFPLSAAGFVVDAPQLPSIQLPQIPGITGPGATEVGNNANGTNFWRGGLSWVGERGPELLNLPRGAQVLPAEKSAAMAGASIVVNQTFTGKAEAAEVRRASEGGVLLAARSLGLSPA